MGWEFVSELAGVRRQVHADLLEVLAHHSPGAFIAAVLPAHEPLPLIHAATDGPRQQVLHIAGNWLR